MISTTALTVIGGSILALGVLALAAQWLGEWASGLEFRHYGTCGGRIAKGSHKGETCPDSLKLPNARSLAAALHREVIERYDRALNRD